MPKQVRVTTNAYHIIGQTLGYAIDRGMNRCDKYSPSPLTDGQRSLLLDEISSSFWLAIEEDEVSLT